MAKYELRLPKMGESVAEATITSWLLEVGDTIEIDDTVVEIATDKVDSEVPSEVEGVLVEKLFQEGEVVQVGQALAVIETDQAVASPVAASKPEPVTEVQEVPKVEEAAQEIEKSVEAVVEMKAATPKPIQTSGARFYSPLVRNIATQEGISPEELDTIPGTGAEGRVTKHDILDYLKNRGNQSKVSSQKTMAKNCEVKAPKATKSEVAPLSVGVEDEVIELSRMGQLIADYMLDSTHKAAHVQSFIEVDVTNLVNWRNKVKDEFFKREGEKITFTPVFMQAVAKTLKEYPLVNLLVEGENKVIKKKDINLGMATALADGNLIVPVIKNADKLNLVGMTSAVNQLAIKAREGKLDPDDIQGGTYTVTNVGAFGTLMGTPIINRPQAAILALGAIRKVPAVIETPEGDFIGIRHKMFLSHSYDHRVINGALGGMFIKSIKDYLESWDVNTAI